MSANIETMVSDYLKENSDQGRSINLSLAKIADQIGCSVASVHRTVQKLEKEGLIRVEKHRARNKPDTIFFLGADEDDFRSHLSQMMQQSSTLVELAQTLSIRLEERQREVQELKTKLSNLENRKIIETVDLKDNMTMVIYQN